MSDLLGGPPDPGPATLAATVVCLRDSPGGLEVLLLRRRSRGAFAGLWVFPGGKVDDVDARPGDLDELDACRRAAAREAAEEAGLVLEAEQLAVWSWWLPPPEAPRRFSTWFFLAAAPSGGGGPIVLSEAEVGEHRWLGPGAALEAAAAGELPLAPPTWVTLSSLTTRRDVASALAAARAEAPQRYLTRAVAGPDGRMVATVWEGDAAYDDGDLTRPGVRRRLRVDQTPWEVELDSPGPAARPGRAR